MSIIQVSCIDQVLTPTSTPVIASGGVKEDSVSFRFCSQWDGFYKTAVFWKMEQQPYHVLLDENNSCVIPAEVLTDDGSLYFGVFGVNDDGVQRTSNVLRYTIEKGTITTNTKPSDPTPDIYTQLLAAIAAFGDNSGKADKVSNATEGDLASLDVNGNLQDSGRKPGAAGGVATLDSDGKVPSGQLPSMDYIPTSQKAAANGVASLGSDGKVPSGQLPSMDYIPTSQKAAAGGVASLDSDGKVPSGQLPSMDYIPTSQKAAANGVASLGSDGKVPSGQLDLTKFLSYTSGTLTESNVNGPDMEYSIRKFGNIAVVDLEIDLSGASSGDLLIYGFSSAVINPYRGNTGNRTSPIPFIKESWDNSGMTIPFWGQLILGSGISFYIQIPSGVSTSLINCVYAQFVVIVN